MVVQNNDKCPFVTTYNNEQSFSPNIRTNRKMTSVFIMYTAYDSLNLANQMSRVHCT